MAQQGWRLSLRRWLNEELQIHYRKMNDLLNSFAVNSENDKPRWKRGNNGIFSVKSVYDHLCSNETGANYNLIWKAKIPLKIKVWLWLIEHNAILTKDNLAKRNWTGDMQCCFCNCTESIDHLFFECITVNYIWSLVAFVLGANHRPTSFGQYWHWIDTLLPNKKGSHMIGLASICWAIWKSRNKCCFEKKANWISDGNYLLSEFFLKILGRSPGGTRQGRSGEWCNDAPQDGITLPRTSPRR